MNLKSPPLVGLLGSYVLEEGVAGGFCGAREKSSEIGDRSM